MAEERSFAEIMDRLRAGDGDAAREVFTRFAHRLIALARSRLDLALRPKLDPEDVLQSVYQSFFVHQAQDRYSLDSWDSLWAMLTVMTLRKCARRRQFFQTAMRDVAREAGSEPFDDCPKAGFEIFAHDPTPSEAARLTETVEQLMAGMAPRERDILSLSLQGFTSAEISSRVGRTERTVQRLLKRIRSRLEEMHAIGSS